MAKKPLDQLTESMFYVLMAFLNQDMCGTDIASYVEEKTKRRVQIGPGTLYAILSKFEEVDYIQEVRVEGRKRTYRITLKGREAYEEEIQRLKACLADGEREMER